MEKLLASVEKSQGKVEKIEITIERHFQQLNKQITKLEKMGHNVDCSGLQFENISMGDFNNSTSFVDALMTLNYENETDDFDELFKLKRKLNDIRTSYIKLNDAKKVVSNWNEKITAKQKQLQLTNDVPTVLLNFINNWGEKAFQWYMMKPHADEKSTRNFIENEKNIKLAVLVRRVYDAVGNIVDAEGLYITESGAIGGIIHGDNGSAEVKTIEAGGWHIQCWHYRTIVNKI